MREGATQPFREFFPSGWRWPLRIREEPSLAVRWRCNFRNSCACRVCQLRVITQELVSNTVDSTRTHHARLQSFFFHSFLTFTCTFSCGRFSLLASFEKYEEINRKPPKRVGRVTEKHNFAFGSEKLKATENIHVIHQFLRFEFWGACKFYSRLKNIFFLFSKSFRCFFADSDSRSQREK